MGIQWLTTGCIKNKNRFLFFIDDVCDDGTKLLPPQKGARPSLTFKEAECQHLNETIYYPMKPDWKPITLVLWDVKKGENPVFEWFANLYNPQQGTWRPSVPDFKRDAKVKLYDGCGNEIETWVFQNAYPQVIEFGELDMGVVDLVTLDLTLRYDRAFIQ
jgi:hypothetical protein